MTILKNPAFLYGLSAIMVLIIAFILNTFLPKTSFFHTFLFSSWFIQFLSSWLFVSGVFFWRQRFSFFNKERKAYSAIKIPDVAISREDVPTLMKAMPSEYQETLTLRRIRELLLALKYGEDIIRLNEELSRRDMADVDRGHLTLDILRNLIPVIGFLGTVVGLSLAMTAFPQVTDPAALKNALKDFAASLSVAFNTTLLALAYTIAIIILASFLRQQEESLVSDVDSRIRAFILKIKVSKEPDGVHESVISKTLDEDGLKTLEKGISKSISTAIKDVGNQIIQKIEDYKEKQK